MARLESGGLTLDESVRLFESGVRLSEACKGQLASAESRIQVLLQPGEQSEVRVKELEVSVDDESDVDSTDALDEEGVEE